MQKPYQGERTHLQIPSKGKEYYVPSTVTDLAVCALRYHTNTMSEIKITKAKTPYSSYANLRTSESIKAYNAYAKKNSNAIKTLSTQIRE